MSLVEESGTGKVRVVYPRKKFAIEPIFCQMEVEGISLERIALPEESVVVMYRLMLGRPFSNSLTGKSAMMGSCDTGIVDWGSD